MYISQYDYRASPPRSDDGREPSAWRHSGDAAGAVPSRPKSSCPTKCACVGRWARGRQRKVTDHAHHHTSPKRCLACSTPPLPLAQLACATPASALLMAGAACPLPALLGGAHFPPARPRAPDGCPCTLTRSARCPNPSLPVCRRCGPLRATIFGARCDAHATPHYGSSSDESRVAHTEDQTLTNH